MPAFGFTPCAEAAPAGLWISLNPIPNRPISPDNGFWIDPHPFNRPSNEANYESDPQQGQDYSSCFGQEERYGYGDAVKEGDDNGLDSHHHDAFYYADASDSAYAPAPSSYTYMPAPIPNNGIPAYVSPYIPACSLAPYPNPWSSLGTASPMYPSAGFGNPLFPTTWGVQGTTSSAQSPYATLAQIRPAYASLQTPTPIFDSPWLQSTPGADSSHKAVTNSMELRQPKVNKASSDNHIEGFWGCGANLQGTPFSTPAAQWDEITKTMTKASGSSVIGKPAADSSSTKKEDNIHDAENTNDTSSKNPNMSSECELLLVSIYNMSTLLTNKLINNSDTEGHLDINMLGSTIGLLSRCLIKQSADNSTKLSCKRSSQSQQSIQEPSSKTDILPSPFATLNKDNAPSAKGALSHEEHEQIVEEGAVKSLNTLFEKAMKYSTGALKEQVSSGDESGLSLNGLYHELELGLCHQAGGVLGAEHSLEEHQTVPNNEMEGSLHSPRSQVCEQLLSGVAEESFGESEAQGDVSASLNGSTNEILAACEGKSCLESVGAFDSDAQDWEYVTSPPGRGCSVFKL